MDPLYPISVLLIVVAILTYLLINERKNRPLHLLESLQAISSIKVELAEKIGIEETQRLRLQSALELVRNDIQRLQDDRRIGDLSSRVKNIEAVLKSKLRYEL